MTLNSKILSAKNELLNLKKYDSFVSDYDSKQIINRKNLLSPVKENFSQTFSIFKKAIENKKVSVEKNKQIGEKIYKNNQYLDAARNDLKFNPHSRIFIEKKTELLNFLKSKDSKKEVSSPIKIKSLSLKQLDINLKNSKKDFCSYLTQTKKPLCSKLNETSKTRNEIRNLIAKNCF